MENNYRILGLIPGADKEQVRLAYHRLSAQYSPDKFTDPAQKRWAQQQVEEIDKAYNELMDYFNRNETNNTGKHTGTETTGSDKEDFYIYIRRLIQHGDTETALGQLKLYPNENEAEWQFLMGSALYYSGYISKSYDHFAAAARMQPYNKEYTATYNRMSQNRTGRFQSSPYTPQQTYSSGMICCDPCTVCQCLICMDACCH